MQLAEPLVSSWKARLDLKFESREAKTVLVKKHSDGPLVVLKPLYPEGGTVCHAIVVHPPGGIAGGDDLHLKVDASGHSLLTTPGATKWYRSAGPWAQQKLEFNVEGTLEWLPRETIVFNAAAARMQTSIRLSKEARFIGWEIACLGRTGSGERFTKGKLRMETAVFRGAKTLWLEQGTLEGGGALLGSPAGLAGHSVFATLVATEVPIETLHACKEICPTTALPGLTIARYLGDSSEEALDTFTRLWKILRPVVTGRDAVPPRIWST